MKAIEIIDASDSSLLVRFGTTIAPELHARVLSFFQVMRDRRDPRIRNLHPAYASLLIDFDPLRLSHAELADDIHKLLERGSQTAVLPARLISIPVCYGAEFGPDLADVAAHNGISVEDAITLHASAVYIVYFLGFSPGFAYLGGLSKRLAIPRLATPRVRVPAGSVGIAGEQTGVYPRETPGGWRLIGRTPLGMFDPNSDPPSRLQPGDRVQFEPISTSAFEQVMNSRLQ